MSDFVINDRRFFKKDGEVSGEEAAVKTQPEKESAEPLQESKSQTGTADQSRSQPPLPPANFTALIVGLATSAFMHFGESPMPGQEKAPERDLPAAKHAIDLLGILDAKTRGNLEEEEAALLAALLHDLRLKYVQYSK